MSPSMLKLPTESCARQWLVWDPNEPLNVLNVFFFFFFFALVVLSFGARDPVESKATEHLTGVVPIAFGSLITLSELR